MKKCAQNFQSDTCARYKTPHVYWPYKEPVPVITCFRVCCLLWQIGLIGYPGSLILDDERYRYATEQGGIDLEERSKDWLQKQVEENGLRTILAAMDDHQYTLAFVCHNDQYTCLIYEYVYGEKSSHLIREQDGFKRLQEALNGFAEVEIVNTQRYQHHEDGWSCSAFAIATLLWIAHMECRGNDIHQSPDAKLFKVCCQAALYMLEANGWGRGLRKTLENVA